MKTRDEAMRDLAEHAQDQCDALAEKMTAIIEGEDDEGEPEDERLCGIGRDKEGRPQLVFSEYGETNRRTVVYVDAILALARLLNGEPKVEDKLARLAASQTRLPPEFDQAILDDVEGLYDD